MTDHVELIADNLDGASPLIRRARARRILSALSIKGLVIVPREPTDKMITTALEHEYGRQPLPSDVEFVYRAMLTAYGGDNDQ